MTITETTNDEVFIEIPGFRCQFCGATAIHMVDCPEFFTAHVPCCREMRQLQAEKGFEEAHGFPNSDVTREGVRLGVLELRKFRL